MIFQLVFYKTIIISISRIIGFERINTRTKLLERAVEKVMKLPENEQDAIAAFILEEIEDETRWDKTFARSQDILAKLAQEAMEEEKSGKTKELDPNTL